MKADSSCSWMLHLLVLAFLLRNVSCADPTYEDAAVIYEPTMLFSMWWECRFLEGAVCNKNSQFVSDVENCGDNRCMCCRFNTTDQVVVTVHMADCSGNGGQHTYIPQLPDSIRLLDFSGNRLPDALTASFFSNVTNITHLFLAYSSVSQIDRSVFREMKNLTCLDLTGNHRLTMHSLQHMLSIPGLQNLTADSCNLPPPSADSFSNITSDVFSLSLGSNSPTGTYDLTGFCSLPQLYSLVLTFVKFDDIATSCVLQLKVLNLIGNLMDTFPVTCTDRNESLFPNLLLLFISRNYISHLSKACLPSLVLLYLDLNMITSLQTGSFNGVQFPHLEILFLRTQIGIVSEGRMRLNSTVFQNPSLKTIDLMNNNLPFCQREIIHSDFLANCPRLEILDLSKNDFRNVDDERFLELFGHLRKLNELTLSDCQIKSISSKTFGNFPELSKLVLLRNEIHSVPDGTFDSSRQLKSLNLSDNKITIIREQTFSAEIRQQLQYLDLSRNSFVCSCDLRWFREWFVSKFKLSVKGTASLTFPDEDYRCHNIPGTTLADFSMPDQACVLSREVSVQIIFSCSLLLASLTLISVVSRFRWHIRLLLYEAFRGRADVRRQRLLADNFDYDVFVSYASEELPWVRQHLMPNLEELLGLRLCVHERDFIPGHNIVDNIAECVESSKKVLMVFSRDFVRSQWCQFELTFCLHHVMNHDDALVIVCVDDVASRDMTTAMMAVLKTTTYIQWDEDDHARDSFWRRLHLALNEVIRYDEHQL